MPDIFTEDHSVLSRAARAPDASVRYGSSAEQIADLYQAGAVARPLVILFHGGYWRPQYDRLHLRPMAQALADAGWPVALPEYARVPGDPDATLADVLSAVQNLPRLVAGSGRVIVAGHSAGGHLALCAAAQPDVAPLAGVLALAPVADLAMADELNVDEGAVREFLGQEASGRPDLDPCRLAAPLVPVTLMHGDADGFAPQALSRSYAAAHPAARTVWLPGTGHFAVIDPRTRVWLQVLTELDHFT